MSASPQHDSLSVEEIAAEWGVTTQTVRNWIKAGELPARRIGRGYRIQRADLDELVARREGELSSFGVNRDPWEPRTLGSPYRARSKPSRAPSVWDGAGPAIQPTKKRR